MSEVLKIKLDEILLEGKESLHIEFKREWHWSKKDEDSNKVQWDKFLRNFSALLNTTYENSIPTKYYIIGYDEKTTKTHNYTHDQYNNKLAFFQENELSDIKTDIIKKIKKAFDIVNYGEEDFSKTAFEPLLEEKILIHTHTYTNNELLIFEIKPLPFLLRLKENRNLGTLKEKEIPFRKIKNNEPGVYALDRVLERNVEKLILKEWNKYQLHSPKNTLQFIVDAYNTSFFKKGKIKDYKIDRPYSRKNFYEIFGLEHRAKHNTLFIYFSKYTSIKKTLKEVLNNHDELVEYEDVFLVLEESHNLSSKRFNLIDIPKVNSVNDKEITLFNPKKRIEYFSPIFDFIDKKNYQGIQEELKKENFFFKGNVTGIFIPAFVKETNKEIITSLELWEEEYISPIKFIIGEGGIGKTTVAKNFAKSIVNKKDILFINSRDLIDKISSVEVNNLYDFVKLFIEEMDIQNDDFLNESMFNILLDSGKFLIIIDGLDEAILNSKKFNSIDFIQRIYQNCINNLGKTKVLCTIRNDFWESNFENTDIGNKIDKLTLKGFDETLVHNFFEKKLSTEKVKKAIKKTKNILGEREEYIPFHLNMILDIVEEDDTDISKSELLQETINTDKLIYGICDRELKMKDINSIDEQLDIFIEMSISYSGECTYSQFCELTQNKFDSYKSHPLLQTIGKKENKKYELQYDILKEDFKELFFLKLLKNFFEDNESIKVFLEEKNQNLILKLNLSKLTERTKQMMKVDDMQYFFLSFLESVKSKKKVTLKNRELVSFLFSLILNLLDKQDKPNYTELLKELFFDQKMQKLHFLSIFNSTFIDKKTFNFEGLKFYDCYINYKYLGDSDFNKDTLFEKCEILGQGYTDKCNFQKENFLSCELSQEIKDKLNESENEKKAEKDVVLQAIKKILKKMYRNNFIVVPKDRLKRNLKGLEIDIFEFLLEKNIIDMNKYTSKEKRIEESLEINKEYRSLLEEIFEGQKSSNKTLKDIVQKFLAIK